MLDCAAERCPVESGNAALQAVIAETKQLERDQKAAEVR